MPSLNRFVPNSVVAEGEDYSNKKLDSFVAIGCSFDRCNFSGMRAKRVNFAAGEAETLYKDCTFNRSRFGNVIGGCARFERCSFEDISIDFIGCDATEFIDCCFSGKLHGYFEGTVSMTWGHLKRKTNVFSGNDFSRTELLDTAFRKGIDLSLQKLPANPEKYIYCPDPEPHIRSLREMFLPWRGDAETRRLAFVAIDVVQGLLEEDQKQLFICKDSLAPVGKDVANLVWERLSQCA